MAHAVWDGSISFGLINISVKLHTLEKRNDIKFHLIDSASKSRVRYVRVSEETGEEVPWNEIVKGYEYDKGQYVLLGDEELEHIRVEATQTIDLQQFVDFEELSPLLFDRPYILVPDKKSKKSYALLRTVLKNQHKAGIGRVVIRTKEYIAAVTTVENALIMNLLRFPQEVKNLKDFDVPAEDAKALKITAKEIKLSEDLIESMTSKWNPKDYHDEYRESLQKYIETKIKNKETDVIEPEETEEDDEKDTTDNVIDFASLLERSLKANKGGSRKTTSKKASGKKKTAKKASSRKSTAKKARKKGA